MKERKFKYFRKTGEIYDTNGQWDGDEGYDFYYTPDSDDLEEALVSIVTEYYFGETINENPAHENELTEKVRNLIQDCDFGDALADSFEEDLIAWFDTKAQDSELLRRNYD